MEAAPEETTAWLAAVAGGMPGGCSVEGMEEYADKDAPAGTTALGTAAMCGTPESWGLADGLIGRAKPAPSMRHMGDALGA